MLAASFGETLTTDEQLVERALAGDSDAFGEVVRRWERKIYALNYGILGSVEIARPSHHEPDHPWCQLPQHLANRKIG